MTRPTVHESRIRFDKSSASEDQITGTIRTLMSVWPIAWTFNGCHQLALEHRTLV